METPAQGPVDRLAVSVRLEAPAEVTLQLAQEVFDAGWRPDYDLRLDAEGTLTLERKAVVRQASGLVWGDVGLVLSTATPADRLDPTSVSSDPARAAEPRTRAQASGVVFSGNAEMGIIDGEFDSSRLHRGIDVTFAAPQTDGPVVTYRYDAPVTLRPDGSEVVLALDEVTLDAEVALRAVPRTDETAFVVATATNPTAEPILPGPARLYREGAFVGAAALPGLAPGAEAEIGFGPERTIALDWLSLSRGEGETGLFTTASTLDVRLAFDVTNTGAEPADVTALHALPFSEQQDVDVDVTTRPAPDVRDWEDRRGVAAWDLTLAPGETRRVEIDVAIDWPEGERLLWRP